MSLRVSLLLTGAALFAVALLPGTDAKNLALSKHQIHQHLAWISTKEQHSKAEDKHLGPHSSAWRFWKTAFRNVDSDGDGRLQFQQLNDLFKEHYNLHHRVYIDDESNEQFTLANSAHFQEEAMQFKDWLPPDHEPAMTYEVVHNFMLKFMDERHKERKGLMEYAQHVYKAEL